MRTILLAGAAVLALGLGSAYAGSNSVNGNRHGSGNHSGNDSGNTTTATATSKTNTTTTTKTSTSVPITTSGQLLTSDSANASGGSQAAAGHGTNLSAKVSGGIGNDNSAGRNASANNGSAAATNGGTADSTDISTGPIAVLADCGCQLAYGNLSTTDSHEKIDVTLSLARAQSNGTVNGGTVRYVVPIAGMNNTMRGSVNGQGILTAQQNTGANSLQQNNVALGSIVGGNGGGLNGFH